MHAMTFRTVSNDRSVITSSLVVHISYNRNASPNMPVHKNAYRTDVRRIYVNRTDVNRMQTNGSGINGTN
jgi:hypothetical protein